MEDGDVGPMLLNPYIYFVDMANNSPATTVPTLSLSEAGETRYPLGGSL